MVGSARCHPVAGTLPRVSATNWAGNVRYQAGQLHHPSSLEQVRRLVAGSKRVHAVGTGHSFSRVADTTGDLVSVAGLRPDIEIDPDAGRVRVAAGVSYGELAPRLHAAGYALPNLASLPQVSVAGACATGTHGSGMALGGLAASVSALEMVIASGDLVTIGRAEHPDRFAGCVVALGALGVVTSLTLDLVPAFELRQYVYQELPRHALAAHWAEILASGYSVSLFTDWTTPGVDQVWLKCLADRPVTDPRWMGARPADGPRHPIRHHGAANCTQQLGVPGPWYARLPHFRPDHTPSAGHELQSEYFVGRQHGFDAFLALDAVRDRIAPVVQVSEIRTVAADDLWLSPSYRRDSVAFHFTWHPDPQPMERVLELVEARLAPFAPRPHWGKLFRTAPEVIEARYPRLPDFARLAAELDAEKFGNEVTRGYLGVRP